MPKIVFNTKVNQHDCSGCRFFDRYKKGGYCEHFKTCVVWFDYGHLNYYSPAMSVKRQMLMEMPSFQ